MKDLGRRARGDELVHDLAAEKARVLDLAVELAVGEQTGATFAELHVALGVEGALAPQAPGVLGALAHRLAALQHDGLEAHFGQRERGEQAARAQAHHHRAFPLEGAEAGGCMPRWVPGHVGCGAHVRVLRVLREQRGLLRRVGEREVDDVDRQQVGLAGVEAALEHPQFGDGGGRDAQHLRRQAGERVDRVRRRGAVGLGFAGGVGGAAFFERHLGQGKLEFGNADHGAGLVAIKRTGKRAIVAEAG